MNTKYLLNLFSAFLLKNKSVFAHYAVTHRCNLRCAICNNGCTCDAPHELNIKEIELVAGFLKKDGIGLVSLGGGEPFMRSDIIDIVKIFSKNKIKIQILTNTIDVENEQINQLLKIKYFNGLSISLHAFSEITSLKFYNDRNLFKKILENINSISSIINKNKILLNTVISPLNIDEIYDIAKFAKDNNFKISFLPIETNNNFSLKFKEPDFKKIDLLYDFLICENKKYNYIFNSSQFLEMSKQYQKGIRSQQYCHAGKLYISINPDGNIAPCHKYHTHDKLNFSDIVISEKNCRDCMRPCWMEISIFFTKTKSFFERIKKFLMDYVKTNLIKN